MVDINVLKLWDTVHYIPKHYETENKFENGVVKSVSKLNNSVFVVYSCAGNWNKFMDYTAARTNSRDLFLGWKEKGEQDND